MQQIEPHSTFKYALQLFVFQNMNKDVSRVW